MEDILTLLKQIAVTERRVARLHTEAVKVLRENNSNGETAEVREAVMHRMGEVLMEMAQDEPQLRGSFILNYLYSVALFCCEYYQWFSTYKTRQEKYTDAERGLIHITVRTMSPNLSTAMVRGELASISDTDGDGVFQPTKLHEALRRKSRKKTAREKGRKRDGDHAV